jgi:hypothetical protein
LLITALVVEITIVLTKELRSANLQAITVAAAESQARNAAAITAQTTLAALRAPRSAVAILAQSILAAPDTPAIIPLALIDQDQVAVDSSAAVAEDPDSDSEDSEEEAMAPEDTLGTTAVLPSNTAAHPRSTAAHPRNTHAPDQGNISAEREDFPSHALRELAAERIFPSLRAPKSRQGFTLTSIAPSH